MSRGKGNSIWHSLCTDTIRNPRRRVPMMRRNFVDSGRQVFCRVVPMPTLPSARREHIRTGPALAETTWSIVPATAWAPSCCFCFPSSVSFKRWLAVGQLRSAPLVLFFSHTLKKKMKFPLIEDCKKREGCWALSWHTCIFHLPSTCCVVFSPIVLGRWEAPLNVQGKDKGHSRFWLSPGSS